MSYTTMSKPEILTKIFECHQRVRSLMIQSDEYKNKGNLNGALGAYNELINTLQKQLELEEENNAQYPESPFEISSTVISMLNAVWTQSDIVEAMGDLEKAENLRNETMNLSIKYLGPSSVTEWERQYANSFIGKGQFNKALVLLTAARDQFSEDGDIIRMANTTSDIAGILQWLGDYDRAIKEINNALELIRPLSPLEPNSEDVVSYLSQGQYKKIEERVKLWQISTDLENTHARANRYLGNYEEAENEFRIILSKVPSTARPAIEFQLGAIAVAARRYKEGLDYVNKLEPVFTGLYQPKLGVLLKLKAEAFLGLSFPDQALIYVDQAINQLSKYTDPDSLWKAQWLRAQILIILNRSVEALREFVQAINTINNLRKAPLGYRLDSTYLRDKFPLFQAAISLSSSTGEAETCCRFIEMIKSRMLTATLSTPVNDQLNKESELDKQVNKLSTQIDALEYQGYQNGWTNEMIKQKDELLNQRVELTERIRFSDPRWRTLSMPISLDIEAILNHLANRDQAAITLFFQSNEVTCVLLWNRKCHVRTVQISVQANKEIINYQKNLQSIKDSLNSIFPYNLKLEADELVPQEFLFSALQAQSLIIVPHGSLHLLPWAGLMFKGKRLFEYCPVSILPNLSTIVNLRGNFSKPPAVALIGDPDYSQLPGLEKIYLSKKELTTIQNRYSPNVIGEVLTGEQATEKGFWRLAKNEDAEGNIFHISSHGVFVTGDPMNSGLLFTDGKADATEIAHSRLRYSEVVLSACSTGYRPTEVQGITLSGDDILGLPGAFLEAGISSILVSIPQIRDDVSLQFMTIYHENREEGKSPMTALQQTQLTMLNSSIYPPDLWIGLTLYGCQ